MPSGNEKIVAVNNSRDASGMAGETAARSVELLVNGSVELSIAGIDQVQQVRELLPFGTDIYLPSLAGRPLPATLEYLSVIRQAGFCPVPHIAARHVRSRDELRRFLEVAAGEYQVSRIFIVGGDPREPTGPYASAAALLGDTALGEAGISEIGIAGYPEGHPRIAAEIIEQSTLEKVSLARERGLGVFMVTQFSFAPGKIVDYCARVARTMAGVPVYVGMAGPSSAVTLLHYARICGVSASLRALSSLGFKAARQVTHTEPNEQLAVLARYCAGREDCNVMGVHIYSFGGFVQTVKWMQERLHSS